MRVPEVSREGKFFSLTDPPEVLRQATAACRNLGAWPVLVGSPGEQDAMLASPIILYDYPQIAPESPGDLFDGTEIDEMLTLRIMTLTDEEKAMAGATDDRTRRLLERTESLAREQLAGLHGAVRSFDARRMAFARPSRLKGGTRKSIATNAFRHARVGPVCPAAGDREYSGRRRRIAAGRPGAAATGGWEATSSTWPWPARPPRSNRSNRTTKTNSTWP